MGKMASEDLVDMLRCISSARDVLVPPMPGFDCGVHKLGRDRCIVISTDPCINVPVEHFGWLLFHYSASDISVFGASPQFCTVELLGPPRTRPNTFKKIMRQFCRSAKDIGALVVSGHTGTYDGLSTILGVCTVYGIIRTSKLVTPAGARPGDLILCTKPIGLEVLTNLALIRKKFAGKLFGEKRTRYLVKQIRMQSCYEEARLLARSQVSAMHDVTEGGLVASLNEMADASNVGFLLDYEHLHILPELDVLAEDFDLSRNQILSISSTGTLLAAIPPEHEKKILMRLKLKGFDSQIAGIITKSRKRLVRYDDREANFPRRSDDPYARIINADFQ